MHRTKAAACLRVFAVALGVCCITASSTALSSSVPREPSTYVQKTEGAASGLAFEVASIRLEGPLDPLLQGGGCRGIDTKFTDPRWSTPLGQCLFMGSDLAMIIRTAYVRELGSLLPLPQRVRGALKWQDDYRVVAKAADPSTATEAQLLEMLKTLLADRFKLKFHFDTKMVDGFALVVAKGGPRLQPSKGDVMPRITGGVPPSPELLVTIGQNASMKGLAGSLSTVGIGPIIDQTGLQGSYDFKLTFEREASMSGKIESQVPATPGTGSSVFNAVERELGLRLVSQKISVSAFVIDSAEKPSEN